ncbi:MAG: molybdenum cofactor guanylyltransferase MobA, partial [Mesorhizobium sp.]
MGRHIAGIILAGGRSSRMGGGDKTLLALGDGTLLDRIVSRLGPQVGPLALSANGDPARFAATGLPVLADTVKGYAGPLAGILTGLEWASDTTCQALVTAA